MLNQFAIDHATIVASHDAADFGTISSSALGDVVGGFDWGELARSTGEGALTGGVGGMVTGAVAGAFAGGVGALPGAVVGGWSGLAGGAVSGAVADAGHQFKMW